MGSVEGIAMTSAATRRMIIDFGKMGGPVFVGRAPGEVARREFRLDSEDSKPEPVSVRIPASVFSINSSYFLALFGPSIRALGSRDAFLAKYVFTCPDEFWETIHECIERALFENSALFHGT